MIFNKQLFLISLLLLLLTGCAAAVIGAGAAVGTTATVAHDRRTTGTFIEDQAIELKAVKSYFFDKKSMTVHISM